MIFKKARIRQLSALLMSLNEWEILDELHRMCENPEYSEEQIIERIKELIK